METQRRLLFLSVAGIIVVLAAMFFVGRYIVVRTVQPAVVKALNENPSQPGPISNRDLSSGNFERVNVEGGWDITIEQAASQSVHVQSPSALSADVIAEVHGGQLTLGFRHGVNMSSERLTAQVRTPDLKRVTVRGGSRIRISGFSASELALDIAGAGNIEGVDNVLDTLSVQGAGASLIDFRSSRTRSARVNLDGAGSVALTMEGGTLSGNLNGIGTIDYSGSVSAENVKINGLGSVRQTGK